ncbi:hypothetical protein D3C87_1124440 [compost metagenome]|uniref:hypothetical protein n=1 Tax=Sphingobacterium faecium TaxID=34087 RepID=UPI000F9E0BEF|nr:hypothetical protein [Sphingobacterium faecium]MQP27893.1 hypothetical protein [Sphingobacterium faecium]
MLICSPKYLVLTFAILLLIVIDLKGQLINNNDIGYIEDYQKLPRINFVKSDAVEYEQCKSLNQFIIPKIKQSKTNFILQTNTGQIKFKKTLPDKKDFNGYEFLGYYPQLNMYAITENIMSDELSFGSLALIDSLTGNSYTIVSIGDGAVETPIISPKANYLIYYYNWLYDGNSCFIGLLKMNKNHILEEYQSFESKNFTIEGIRWLDNDTFIVKTLQSVYIDGVHLKEINYYRASLN